MKKIVSAALACLLILSSAFTNAVKEEGMFLLSMLSNLDLAKAGLRIPASDIFNESGNSLTHALVRLGGCTGSFISNQGLIITNHHCVYGSVSSISTKDNNLLDNGFYATDQEKEIKINLTCKITQSFEDVSARVLKGIDGNTLVNERANIISKNIEAIVKAEQASSAKYKIEVSEMMVGKYYTLFRYKVLDDVRLVFVPPSSVGKFGGESDNWVWPRHNGDFSVVRAYENGVPYTPARHLKINPAGTAENDFIFVLGYPGRTYRHMPAEYFTYQYKHILPFISNWYDYKISVLEDDACDDVNKQLGYAGTIASWSNVTKNYKGKIQGLTRTDIIDNKYKEQQMLQNWIEQDADRTKRFGHLFRKIDSIYDQILPKADANLMLGQLYNSSGVFWAASFISELKNQTKGLNKKQKAKFFAENQKRLAEQFKKGYSFYNENVDKKLLKNMLQRMASLSGVQNMAPVQDLIKGKDEKTAIHLWVEKSFKKSKLKNSAVLTKMAETDISKLLKLKEPMIDFAAKMNEVQKAYAVESGNNNQALSALLPQLADLKEAYYKSIFIPDANATLRFTYGYVKGYQPQDAVTHKPFTTIKGILDKAEDKGDYYMPPSILSQFESVQAADVLKLPNTNDVVVAMLYNLDTTGGNSGSPILNADGELVGVNFDRAFTATINDFAWNESYSRSIGVDIRYVLYVMKYLGKADPLLDEMGVKL